MGYAFASARLTFAVDPANAANNRLVASICGLNTWEMISIIHKGANYGFPLREGNEAVTPDNGTTALPANDRIPVMVNGTVTAGTVAPTYPVIIWGHDLKGGDCAGSGYLYNGKSVPALRGKFVTATSRPAASGTRTTPTCSPRTMGIQDDGRMHAVKIRGRELFDTMFTSSNDFRQRGSRRNHEIAKAEFQANVRTFGLPLTRRGDVGYSKSDGMISRSSRPRHEPAHSAGGKEKRRRRKEEGISRDHAVRVTLVLFPSLFPFHSCAQHLSCRSSRPSSSSLERCC